MEAVIFGGPLISWEIGNGTSYANAHEETVFVVEPEFPSALAVVMNKNILLKDHTLATAMGEEARSRY